MRRRRNVLQVSTFPFLAVLLCAMGSLILLLLVIDRRAKVVMRAKALETVRRMEKEDEKEAADRAAEWERRRLALHEHLQQQTQELDAQKASLEQRLTAISHDLQTEQAREPALEQQLRAEQVNLIREEKVVASRLQETAQKKQQSEGAQAELVRLTNELAKLQQTLADLKALRQRQQQTYSLVPYRGRRGDNRRPIYLECAAGALILHPERSALAATDSSVDILQEVQKRITRLEPTSLTGSSKPETPYLLLLVRPDGILTYYRTLAALKDLQVDFGYEFVEPDWILSFPEDDNAAGTQRWMASVPAPENNGPKARHDTATAQRTPVGAAGNASYPSRGIASRAGSDRGDDLRALTQPGSPESEPFSRDPTGERVSPTTGAALAGTTGPGSQTVLGNPLPIPSRSQALLDNGLPNETETHRQAELGGMRSQAELGNEGRNEGHSVFPSRVREEGGNRVSERGAPTNSDSGKSGSALDGGQSGSPTANTTEIRPALPRIPSVGEQGDRREAGAQAWGSDGLPTGSKASDKERGTAGVPPPESEEAGPQIPSSGLGRLGATREKKSEAPPVVRRYVRREWNIFIECTAEQVVIYPGGSRISKTALGGALSPSPTSARKEGRPLFQAIQQMISRRQAVIASSNANGDAPLPQIRFLVRPDGLRTYFFAFPELAPLQLLMTRENLDADEDVVHHITGR